MKNFIEWLKSRFFADEAPVQQKEFVPPPAPKSKLVAGVPEVVNNAPWVSNAPEKFPLQDSRRPVMPPAPRPRS